MILVVAPPADNHAPPVIAELKRRGRDVAQLDVADFPTRAALTIGLEGGSFFLGTDRLDFRDIEAVWLRRITTASVGHLQDAAFATAEWWHCLVGLSQVLKTRWVNSPRTYFDLDGGWGKIRQLEAALKVGLSVPRTCITSEPETARAFVESCRETGAVYKAQLSTTAEVRGVRKILWTTAIDASADFAAVRGCPCIFQERVPKRADVRATVFGDRVFACEIDSQGHEDSATDYRTRWLTLPRKRCALPDDVAEKLVAWHRELGLAMGSADLVATPDGRYVALETNCQGTWAWCADAFPAGAMVEAMADLLGRQPSSQ